MATEERREVIVEREPRRRSSLGTIIAVILGVLILLALLMYGLPALTGGGTGTSTGGEVQTPAPSTGTTTE